MTVTQMGETSKARGCSTDRSGTTVALLAGSGAYGVRDGPSTRPLSVHPTGGCGGGNAPADCSVRQVLEFLNKAEMHDSKLTADAIVSRPGTDGPTPHSRASSGNSSKL